MTVFGSAPTSPGNVGVVDDRAVRLRGDFEKPPERIEPSDDLFGHDLFFQVGQGVRSKVCPSIFIGVQRDTE